MKVPVNFPEELLSQSSEEFAKYYESLHEANGLRNARAGSDDFPALSYQELSDLITPYLKNYPDLGIEKDISRADLNRIFSDFKSIKTVDEIREKSDIIIAYYDAFLKQDVLPKIIEYKRNLRGAKVSGIGDPFGHMTPHEESVVMNWPRYVPAYSIAAGQATSAGNNTPGGGGVGKKGDAVRHSTWNCFIIRNAILAGASKNTAVNFAYQGTTAHEKNGTTGAEEYHHDGAMDLYNNLAGRTWMESETGWGVVWARKMPSEPKIVNTMRIRADRAFKYNPGNYVNEILNPAGGWSSLYGLATKSGHGELVYYND